MAEQNPFEPPSEKPPPLDSITSRRLLELPNRGPPREAFGDYAFWPMLFVAGVVLTFVMLLTGRLSLFGIGLAVYCAWKWIQEAARKR